MNELAQDEALVQEFLTESDELMQRMEQDLLSLEGSSDAEMLNRIFRAMHTVKGTSGFLGFDRLVEVTHKAEDVLNSLRRHELSVTHEITDLMLSSVDLVKKMLADVREKRHAEYDLTPWLAQLEAARSSATAKSPTAAVRASDVAVVKDTPAAPAVQASEQTTMRVDLHKLDHLVNLVGELVLERNRLAQIGRDLAHQEISRQDFDTAMSESLARLSFVTDELQVASLGTRMVPIDAVFKRLPRLVRDLSASLGKKVELVMEGRETEIDRTMTEHIGDPLVHLIRNCLDHGIEASPDRIAAGKSPEGTIKVDAHEEGDHIVVSIIDDGKGIDPAKIVKKAIEREMITAEGAKLMTHREILDLIFQPGFSTAEKVNDVSGRGVGMDVVRTNIKRLNGTVEIDSTPGKGTTIQLRMPLTMAIMPVLVVEAATEVYAIPLRSVLEIVRVPRRDLKTVDKLPVLCLREKTIPLIHLSGALGRENNAIEDRVRVVILTIGESLLALAVDRFIGQESTVIKSLGNYLRDCRDVAGATIGGDGRVRLVLDPASLLASVSGNRGAIQ